MEKEYQNSRYIILFIFLILLNIPSLITFTWSIGPSLLALIFYLFSYPSTISSKLIIKYGDKIKNKVLKILYYTVLPIVIYVISIQTGHLLVDVILSGMDLNMMNISTIISGILNLLLVLLCISILIIGLMMPYIQTFIVLILRSINKSKRLSKR